jgi:hypothetical protein
MALEGGDGSASRPGRFLPPGNTQFPLYRRLGGPQGQSGQARKISPPPGFFFFCTSHLIHKTKQYIHVGVVKSEHCLLNKETQQNHAFSCQIYLPKPPNTLHAHSGEETCSKSLIQYAEVISHQFPPSRLCMKFPPCPLQKAK